MTTLSSLVAPEVVVMTTYGAISDDKIVIACARASKLTTTNIQSIEWCHLWFKWWLVSWSELLSKPITFYRRIQLSPLRIYFNKILWIWKVDDIDSRYIAVEYNTTLNISRQRENLELCSDFQSQKTSRTLLLRANYGMSFVSSFEKDNRELSEGCLCTTHFNDRHILAPMS